jgi:hypothetical protein
LKALCALYIRRIDVKNAEIETGKRFSGKEIFHEAAQLAGLDD